LLRRRLLHLARGVEDDRGVDAEEIRDHGNDDGSDTDAPAHTDATPVLDVGAAALRA
jgi:hypothetical protein